MWASTTPAEAPSASNRRPASSRPSADGNVTAREPGEGGGDEGPHAGRARLAIVTAAASRTSRNRGAPTAGPRLLAQLHALVPRALQELLVLLLAHLLAALLDQRRQAVGLSLGSEEVPEVDALHAEAV